MKFAALFTCACCLLLQANTALAAPKFNVPLDDNDNIKLLVTIVNITTSTQSDPQLTQYIEKQNVTSATSDAAPEPQYIEQAQVKYAINIGASAVAYNAPQ